jgi:TRAP-type mannitol/chloroaromatic compound transport system substrate-binding protein
MRALERAFEENLSKVTNGRFKVTVYPLNELVSMFDLLEACGDGVIESYYSGPAAFVALDPAFAVFFTMPGIWDLTKGITQARMWASHYGGLDMYRELADPHNVYIAGYITTPPESVFSTRPLRTLDDFKGLKIRTPSGLTADLFAKLGASPTPMSGGELYTAMDTGVLDAFEWISMTEIVEFGLAEVSDYILWPSFHSPIALTDFGVNKDKWSELPDDLKVAFEMAIAQAEEGTWYGAYATDLGTLDRITSEGLVEHTQLSSQDFETVKQMAREVAIDYRNKSPMSAKMIDSILAFIDQFNEIELK